LFDIQMQGLTPIPERDMELMEHPNLLNNLVEKGVFTRVPASSVIGHFGKKVQKFALQTIKASLTHFIASNVHNTTSRCFCMREAHNAIRKEFGINTVYMLQENAELLVTEKAVYRDV